jgi:hypothetical protein
VAAEAAYRAGIAGGDNHCRHNLGSLLCELDRCDEAVDLFRAGAERGDALAAEALAAHLTWTRTDSVGGSGAAVGVTRSCRIRR